MNEVPQSQRNGQVQTQGQGGRDRSRSASPARDAYDSTPPPAPTHHTAHRNQDPPSNPGSAPHSTPGSAPQSRSVSPPRPGVNETGNTNYQPGNGSGSVNGGRQTNLVVDHNTQRLPDPAKPPAIPVNSAVNYTANSVHTPVSSPPPPPPAPKHIPTSLVSNDEKQQPQAEIAKGGCCVIA